MANGNFSMNEFIKWLEKNSDKTNIVLINDNGLKIGEQVVIRLSEKNMIDKLSYLNEDKKEIMPQLCENLKKNGGILRKIKGSNAEIQVLGTDQKMYIPRLFLRRVKKS